MAELKFLRGSVDKFNSLSKNNNYFYIAENGNYVELYLGNKLIAKSSTPNDLLIEINRAISVENNLQEQIDAINTNGGGNGGANIDLSNYYTKTEVDNLIPNDYLTEIPSEYVTETELIAKNYATLSEVETKVSNLVDSAPDALNTLNELASALGNDPNFATTMINNLATKADITTVNTLETKVNTKANSADVYTKTEVDNLITKVLNTPT